MLQKGNCDPFGNGLQQVGRLSFKYCAGGLLEPGVADRVLDAVAGCRVARVQRDVKVGGEGLAELAFGRVVAVVAEGR